MRAAVDDGDVHLIDTMMTEHYRGEWALYGRPGHIPGASNVSALSLFGELGRYLPDGELAAMHPGDRDARVITYCGGGIAAASNAFVMTRLGFTNVAVYAASLQEWVADPSKPDGGRDALRVARLANANAFQHILRPPRVVRRSTDTVQGRFRVGVTFSR